MRLARASHSRPDLQQAVSPRLTDRRGTGRAPAAELHPERPQAEVRLGSEQGLAPPLRPAPQKAPAGQPDARELPGKPAATDHSLPAEAGRGPPAPAAPELARDARAAPRRDGRTSCRAPAGQLAPPLAVLARGSGLDESKADPSTSESSNRHITAQQPCMQTLVVRHCFAELEKSRVHWREMHNVPQQGAICK